MSHPGPPSWRPVVASFYRVLEPIAARPFMPGYGTLPAGEGTGLLPWSWVVARLASSHDFWLATVTPQGAPHLMPVWAVWHSDRLWFSSANGSRKARNLSAEARCTLSTDNPQEPVVAHGRAERITGPEELRGMLAAENAKYHTDYGPEMVDPARNSVYALRLDWVFALDASDFAGSPTRFTFGPATAD
jgi:nitroimidazol reductase NimA-like FMN-containing flavoprotein (pyridoxamine 5'-phosphate oxidase superfamily)